MFKSIQLRNWRQFSQVEIDFHPRLTVLTGANGAGKTTILHILNRHWGWNIHYVSTPQLRKRGSWRYWTGFWEDESSDDVGAHQGHRVIGSIEYVDQGKTDLLVPHSVQATFDVTFSRQARVPGVYVPSHRPLYFHQKVEDIPTNVDARQQIFDVYMNEIRNRWANNQRVRTPSYTLKRSLISLAVFGFGNDSVTPNADARSTFEGFERVLATILPESLGFRKLSVRVPEVMLETNTGDIAFDAVSGGISALIDIAWQVFLYSQLEGTFVVAIDEPEAHLHPALQRRVLPNLLDAFPSAQFIVASHNPFVVSSSRESNVYVLHYDERQRVRSTLLESANKAGSANELLRDVLGVESTTAVWVDRELESVLERFRNQELTQELLDALRIELSDLGLTKYLPESLDALDQ